MSRTLIPKLGLALFAGGIMVLYGMVFISLFYEVDNKSAPLAAPGGHVDPDVLDDLPSGEGYGISCTAVCWKLFECGLVAELSSCRTACADGFAGSIRVCILEEDCAAVQNECLAGLVEGEDSCRAVCDKLDRCGLLDVSTCRDECVDFDDDLRSCIRDTGCPRMLSSCFGVSAINDASCSEYCDKLVYCDALPPDGLLSCLTSCLTDPTTPIECVLQTECEMLFSWCLEQTGQAKCQSYCTKMEQCDLLFFDQEREVCLASCANEPQALVECVLQVPCDHVDFCFGGSWSIPDCDSYCDKMLDCGFYGLWERDTCLDECSQETPESVWCVLSEPCDAIETSCWRNPYELDCEETCTKLLNCGLVNVDEPCMDICQNEFADDTIGCIRETPCDLIDAQCSLAPEPATCNVACKKLYDCRIVTSLAPCENECFDTWSSTMTNCIESTPCVELLSVCF